MNLDGARADPKPSGRFFVRFALQKTTENVLFSARQWLASGEIQRLDVLRGARRPPPGRGVDRLANTRDDVAAAERLLDKIKRSVLDGVHRHGDVALAGHDEDGRRIILGVEFLQKVDAG